jgi:hypothetical protein
MRHVVFGAFVLAIVLARSIQAASSPAVRFSTSHAVACRDVTPPEFAALYPNEKLIEAQFRVSVLLWQGSEQQIDELLVIFSSPQRRLRVVDFWPKTESVTDITGPIERSETNDSNRSIETGLKGSLSGGQAGLAGQLTPSVSAATNKHTTVKEMYRKLPPKQLLLASGPLDGDSSVFFKLKPSTQASLEGARLFSCVFAVPADWRGDWATLTCLAKGQNTRQLVGRTEECGRASFHVGLYLEGDPEARLLAEQLDQASASADSLARELGTGAAPRSLAAARSAWPSSVWRAIGLRRSDEPHETFKPPVALPQALEALRALSGG